MHHRKLQMVWNYLVELALGLKSSVVLVCGRLSHMLHSTQISLLSEHFNHRSSDPGEVQIELTVITCQT
jgi:hypothetical protein